MEGSTAARVPAVKDGSRAHQVPSDWRPALRAIASAFAAGDYGLTREIPGVVPVDSERAEQIREYVEDYGETLAELPEETWRTSVSQWTGTGWDVLVDLWTVESGRSDLVLSARILELPDGYMIKVHLVYVP